MRISDWSSDVCSSDLSRSNSRVVQNRWNNQRRWDRDWRNDRRYDWRDYRNSHRRNYRMPRYYAPRGWHNSYSRYSVGIYLNDLLFARNYWIDEPYYYRLPPAYEIGRVHGRKPANKANIRSSIQLETKKTTRIHPIQ